MLTHILCGASLAGLLAGTAGAQAALKIGPDVGEANFDPAFPFPTLNTVEKFAGSALIIRAETIQAMRDAAK